MDASCGDCGAPLPRVSIGGVSLCDACADQRISTATGWPTVGAPPDPIVLTGPDGVAHTLVWRVWRAPTGIQVELSETDVPTDTGFHVAVLGAHDHDLTELFREVQARAEHNVAHRYLEPDPNGSGWLVEGCDVAGRFVLHDDHHADVPLDVVVDGRLLTWNEFGRTLGSFEGWRFRMVIEDVCDDLRPDTVTSLGT